MDYAHKREQLRDLIYDSLLPRITGDYVLWDVPYHSNIGDLLIWKGELDFLKRVPRKRLDMASFHTYAPKPLAKGTVILLHGGGNFGDIWQDSRLFRQRIIPAYPDNPIIILPQTVGYRDEENLKADALLMARHPDLTICARDRKSYAVLEKHFSANRILLLPDMAFCIPPEELAPFRAPADKGMLFVKRKDREGCDTYPAGCIQPGADISDWPTMETKHFLRRLGNLLLLLNYHFPHTLDRVADRFFRDVYLPYFIRMGVRFVSPYRTVYTTRLHAGILCALLGKPVMLTDNNYGKNSSFYETWLSDSDDIKFLK